VGGGAIEFRDESGKRWTVTRRPAGDLVRLEFVSDESERRRSDVVPLDEPLWAEVNEQAWQALLRQAEADD
jgi:hypothetical protein